MTGSSKSVKGLLRLLSVQVERLSAWPAMRAIRDGLLGIVPCLILSAALLLVSVCLQLADISPEGQLLFQQLHERTTAALPYLITASIAYMVSIQSHLPRLPIICLNVVFLFCVADLMENYNGAARVVFLLSALILPIWATRGLAKLHSYPWCQIVRHEGAGTLVRQTLNFIIPGVIMGGVVLMVAAAVILALPDPEWINYYLFFDAANEPYRVGVLYSLFNSVLWFFGVHGYHALLPLMDGLNEAVHLNHSTVMAGGSGLTYPMNTAFLGAFVFIGGSGATLSLALAILLTTRVKSLRFLGLASLPFALINVNELLLFGLPIIFNPRLLIPFLVAPVLNVLIGQTAIMLGWVQAPFMDVPFNSPVILNAYLATGGNFGAVLLQLVCLTAGVLVYRPFIKGLEPGFAEVGNSVSRSIETLFARRFEEAEYHSRDPVAEGLREHTQRRQLQHQLGELGDYEFLLEYQPQIDPHSGRVTGVEALVRAENSHGQLLSPGQFMPQLEQGGMMKSLDLWVAAQASRQASEWARQGYGFKVSINLSPEGLCDARVVDELLSLLTASGGHMAVEITEQALTARTDIVRRHIDRIRSQGIAVYIDDFGTGYSSLGYLSQYSIDAIKVDRSFVLALNSDKGAKVFNGILGFADALELDLVIEGVETETQLAHVIQSSRVSVQGWLYSKSLSSDRVAAFIESFQNRDIRARTGD
ncbi:PTS sugar transporter subunit IIC/EAL domain-containing protein [Marinobacterium sp. AK62]|uniref:PTS sugar transporter subunit IIC/EAL domain-containing protein n=1 Tax=Marinobacterium alkalitolerans TaxID=1542925 RepID=A0ABS3Z8V5_9GAMM|nr:EAL domain-containing protein [Marinobacterium alkalitolerans]MBP0048143.1 PTS sugar transporter subunit IIC/EAL domain-containing protein [Marinobacterium alkalitolerans]